MKKEKRRLQEKFRRQRKIQDNQRILQDRYKEGSQDGTLPNCNVNLKCGRCGMFGHMKTNKSCPVYVHDEEEEQAEKKKKEEKKPSSVVKVKGLRLSVSKQKVTDKKSTLGKRKRGEEDEDEDKHENGETNEDKPKPKPKRRRAPAVKQGALLLSKTLERIWKVVSDHHLAEPFRLPVSSNVAFDYYEIITNAIDLSAIHKKIKDLAYKSVSAFIADFELMRDNCYKYNQTRFVSLLQDVDELISVLHAELAKEQNELREVEAIIEKESKTRSKPRQKAKKPAAKARRPKTSKSKKSKAEAALSLLVDMLDDNVSKNEEGNGSEKVDADDDIAR